MYMLVSIIITTKNEEKNIENCLRSIQRQQYPSRELEVIVVDNFSTDTTDDRIQAFTKKFPELSVHTYKKGPERSAQRNFGVEKSRGDYFIYLDADMILHENVIADCVRKVSEEKGLLALYVTEIVLGKKYFSQVRRFERSFYDGTVIDCVRFIKKSAFQEVGGFDENLTGPEDWDLDKKLRERGNTALVTTPIYHNESEFELKKYLNKKGYYAKKFDDYIAKWGKNDPDVKKQLGARYRLIGVFIEGGKWKRLLGHPALTFGVFYLRLLVGLKFLTR